MQSPTTFNQWRTQTHILCQISVEDSKESRYSFYRMSWINLESDCIIQINFATGWILTHNLWLIGEHVTTTPLPPYTTDLWVRWQRQITNLIEADTLQLAAEIDTLRTDAEDVRLLQPSLGVDRSNRHGRRQCGRNSDGDDVKDLEDDDLCTVLENAYQTNQRTGRQLL